MKTLIEINEVYTFKTQSGEEIVARVTAVDNDWITVQEPVSVAPGPQGMGLIPALFTGDHAKSIRLNTQSVVIFVLTDETVKLRYIEATTGIRVPEKKLVLG